MSQTIFLRSERNRLVSQQRAAQYGMHPTTATDAGAAVVGLAAFSHVPPERASGQCAARCRQAVFWLEANSIKAALSRPTHQRVSREYRTGQAANRWAG